MAFALKCAADGDESAERYVYVRCADIVYGYLQSVLRDSADAESITFRVFRRLRDEVEGCDGGARETLARLLEVADEQVASIPQEPGGRA